MQSMDGAAVYASVKAELVTGKQMCRNVACWQNSPDKQKLTSPTFSGSAGKLGPCLSSDVRGLKKNA